MGNSNNNTNVKSTLLSLSEKESRVCGGIHGPDWRPKESYSWLDWIVDVLTPSIADIVPLSKVGDAINTILTGVDKASNFDDIQRMSPMEAKEALSHIVSVREALNEQIVKRTKATLNAKSYFSSVTATQNHFTKEESQALSDILSDNEKAIRCFKERKNRLDRLIPVVKKRASDPIEA